jgi:heptosyltransferase-2
MPRATPPPALVVQTAFLGDVVLTTPLLAALAARHGPVDVVTTPGAAPLLETHPAVRRVIPFDKKGTDRGFGGLWRLARRLRAEHYAIAYLPHRSLRSAALALLAGVPRRIGFHDGWRVLYTGVRRHPETGHAIDRLLALADAPPRHQTLPSLELTLGDRSAAERWLREAEIGGTFVALAPGSIWGSKRWPYYPELAARLAQQVAVVAVGGPEDRGLGDAVVRAVADAGAACRAANACGALGLRESTALLSRAAALVTNDSAPLHLAQAVAVPTIAVFGPTIPEFGFGPRGPRDQALGVAGLSCRPCSRHGPPSCPLGHHRCMTSLRVEDVLHAIEETGALRRRD